MQTQFIAYIFLILIIMALVMLANRLKVVYPIVLVVGGLSLSFTSAFSHITISPEIVLTLLTPHCMYYATEYFHYSGVLEVVSGGLFLSSKHHCISPSPMTMRCITMYPMIYAACQILALPTG